MGWWGYEEVGARGRCYDTLRLGFRFKKVTLLIRGRVGGGMYVKEAGEVRRGEVEVRGERPPAGGGTLSPHRPFAPLPPLKPPPCHLKRKPPVGVGGRADGAGRAECAGQAWCSAFHSEL